MFNNRWFIGGHYLVLAASGFFLPVLNVSVLLPLLLIWLLAVLGGKRSDNCIMGYYTHIRRTSFVSMVSLAFSFGLMFVSVYINYQLSLILPTYELIREFPGEFVMMSNGISSLVGLLCLGIVLMMAYRIYKGLLAVIRMESIA